MPFPGGRGARGLVLALVLGTTVVATPGCASTIFGGDDWACDFDQDDRVDWWEVLGALPVLAVGLVVEAAWNDLVGADDGEVGLDADWDEPDEWFDDELDEDERRNRRRRIRRRACRGSRGGTE